MIVDKITDALVSASYLEFCFSLWKEDCRKSIHSLILCLTKSYYNLTYLILGYIQ